MNNLETSKKFLIGTANLTQKYGITNLAYSPKKLLKYAWEKNFRKLDISVSYSGILDLIASTEVSWELQGKIVLNDKHSITDQVYNFVALIKQELPDCKIFRVVIHNFENHKNAIQNSLEEINKTLYSLELPKIGISVYDLETCFLFLKKYFDKISSVQFPTNVFDSRFTNYFEKERSFFGVRQARSIYLQGSLLNENLAKTIFPQYHEIFDEWFRWCEYHKVTCQDQILSQIISSPFVDEIVVGVSSLNHIDSLNHLTTTNKVFKPSRQIPIPLIDPRKWNSAKKV